MVCLRQRHQTSMTKKAEFGRSRIDIYIYIYFFFHRDQERDFQYTSRTLRCVHHVGFKFQKIPRPQPVRGFWKILISGRTTVYILRANIVFTIVLVENSV